MLNLKILLILMCLSIFNFVSAIDYEISDEGVKIDKNIEDKFLYQSEIYVLVTLKDNSGIVYNGTKEEKHEQGILKREWFDKEIKEILSSFSEDDFVFYQQSSFGFSGLISEEGLGKMKNMKEIEAIELNYYGFANSVGSIFNLKWYVYGFFILIITLVVFLYLNLKRSKYVRNNLTDYIKNDKSKKT